MNLDRKSIVKFVASVSAILMLLTLLPSAVSAIADMDKCQSGVCSGECNRSCIRNCTEASNMFSGSNGVGDCLQVRACTGCCDPEDSKVSVTADRTLDSIQDQLKDFSGDCECDGAGNCDCEGDQLKDQDQIRTPTQDRTGDCDGDCVNQV